MEKRIRCAPLRDKITDPATAAQHIGDGENERLGALAEQCL